LDTDDILFERRGAAGLVTLNRPKALNAVTHGMVRALRKQLDAWTNDGAVSRVSAHSPPAATFARFTIRARRDNRSKRWNSSRKNIRSTISSSAIRSLMCR
jgi:enoyl-CoA hydratase/carnithine racemase